MLAGLTSIPAIPAVVVPFLVLGAVGLGVNSIHIWRQRVESGRERIRALEAEQQTATRLAVEQERARIARELHDVVTHNVGVMVIQAGAARKIMDAEPEQARQALLAVESGGRAAMSELRHVMGLLTRTAEEPLSAESTSTLVPLDAAQRSALNGAQGGVGDGAAAGSAAPGLELAPQPGLGQVAALAGRIRDAGVPVELTVSGTPTPLPAGVDLAAYRVVQEALTNAVKHAVGASVYVIVDYAPETVRVEVADNGGRPGAPAGPGNGRGLIGLRERLAMYGGTLQAGRRPTGGYRVRAVIPLEQP
jgi:signal transduction histidine kinase